MELLQTALTAAFSVVVLFISAKLMGHRQISQLDVFDYINGITLGSISAELATNIEEPLKPLVAMLVYLGFTLIINTATNKSSALQRFFNGTPTVIMNDGRLNRENMKKARLDLGEFLMMCRQEGYFDLSQIQAAVFESNGRLTIMPTADTRPISAADIGIIPPKEAPFTELIMDGRILSANLKRVGRDESWLFAQLSAQGYSTAGEVFLGLYGNNGKLSLYRKIQK
ncbi:MAG: DUF421 domain-containing protein [Oscillospiraceae bacterium]